MKKKNNKFKKKFNKNKYNIVLILILGLLSIFLLAKIVDTLSNRNLLKYDKEIIVIKNNDSEIISLTLKELRKMESKTTSINQQNGEVVNIEGVPLDKLINRVNIDPTLNKVVEFTDDAGNKTVIALESALDVDRVYLAYKINERANIDYDKTLGSLFVVDSQQGDSSKWIKNIKIINIK